MAPPALWFHVWVKIFPDRDLFEFDLTKQDLTNKILSQYRAGELFLCGGSWVQPRTIESLRIFMSTKTRQQLIRSAIYDTLKPPEDPADSEWLIKNLCADVTNKVLTTIPNWLVESLAVLNVVSSIVNRIDPGYTTLESWISGLGMKRGRSKNRECDFERAIAILLHLSGLNTVHVGCEFETASMQARVHRYNKAKISIDVLAYLPDKSHVYLCQCTTDWDEQKVSDLIDITNELRLDAALSSTCEVHPVLISTADKTKATGAVIDAESNGVKVIGAHELEILLKSIKQRTQSLFETRRLLSLDEQ